MKKQVTLHVVGQSRPSSILPEQKSFIAVVTTPSGHAYQLITNVLWKIGETKQATVEPKTGEIEFGPEVIGFRKMHRPTKKLLETLRRGDVSAGVQVVTATP
jgi:hypothetical protein